MPRPRGLLWLLGGTLLALAPLGLTAPADAPKPDARKPADGLDDPLPKGAFARLGTTRWRHGNAVTSVAFGGDGKTLAAAGIDNAVRIWEVPSGRELRHFVGQGDHAPPGKGGSGPHYLALSPDGKTLAVAYYDMNLRLLDTATGKELARLPGSLRGQLVQLSFSADGKLLVLPNGDREVSLLEMPAGKEVRKFQGLQGLVRAAALSPDGKVLASGDAGTVRLWDVKSGNLLRKLRRHQGPVTWLSFSPDGKKAASISDEDATARVWDVATGRHLVSFSHRHTALLDAGSSGVHEHGISTSAVLFTPDGKAAISSAKGDRFLRLWDADTGKELRAFEGHPGGATSIALSSDGKTLAAASEDSTIRTWDVASGKPLSPDVGHRHRLHHMAFTADGKRLITCGRDGTQRVWDIATRKEIVRIGDPMNRQFRVAVSPDGKFLATGRGDDETVTLYDLATGKEVRQLSRQQHGVAALIFAADSKTLAALAADGTIALWDAVAGKELRSFGQAQPNLGGDGVMGSLSFSPDGKRLAVLTNSQTVVIHETATGQVVLRVPSQGQQQSAPFQATWSPDGSMLATAASDNSVALWSAATGRWLRNITDLGTLSSEGMMIWDSAVWSWDGKLLATAGRENDVRVWEAATGKEVAHFGAHVGWVSALAFAPDGRSLASGSLDTTVLLWDLTGLFSPDGNLPAKELVAGDLPGLWADLGGDDAAKAMRAMWLLAAAPKQSVPLLREKLKPKPGADAKRLKQLIADLDSDSFQEREKATKELATLGELAEPALRKALADGVSLEVKRRIEGLLEKRGEMVLTADALREVRAVMALERMESPEGRKLLEALAKGDEAGRLTLEAKAALERLNRRQGTKP